MTSSAENRRAQIAIDARTLWDLIRPGGPYVELIIEGLPADARPVWVGYEIRSDCVYLTVESPALEPVPMGQLLTLLPVQVVAIQRVEFASIEIDPLGIFDVMRIKKQERGGPDE